MAVSSTVTLPAQPTVGESAFTPLGGDGKLAPLGCYLTRINVVGDASGTTATLQINLDPRYTNLVAWVLVGAQAMAAAGEFEVRLLDQAVPSVPTIDIVGTLPHVAEATFVNNASFLWYPPPVYFQQKGIIQSIVVNIDATETYKLTAQIYCFDANVLRLAPLPFLQWNVPGVSAPAAI